jgi:prevent-host-death family protein
LLSVVDFTIFILMSETVSAAEANRAFSRLLREVREEGRNFVVTAHGRPVARVVPVEAHNDERHRARAALRARLTAQPATDIGRWTRDELYER